MTATADFSPMLRRGVVYTDGGTYIIEVDKMYKPEEAGTTHIAMWMQGPGDIQEVEAGEYPFREVYDRMKNASDKLAREIDRKFLARPKKKK